jgi:hypothetical protein
MAAVVGQTPLTEEQVLDAYRGCFGTRDGAVVLRDLEEKFGANPFCPENPHLTDYRCGALRVLQEVTTQIGLAWSRGAGQTKEPFSELTSDVQPR